MECIESIAQPTSTVRTPIFDSIGPTVEPQGLSSELHMSTAREEELACTHISFRTSNSCTFPPFFSTQCFPTKVPMASVA